MKTLSERLYLIAYRIFFSSYPRGTLVKIKHDQLESIGTVVGKWKKPKAPFGYIHSGSLVLFGGKVQEKEIWELGIF